MKSENRVTALGAIALMILVQFSPYVCGPMRLTALVFASPIVPPQPFFSPVGYPEKKEKKEREIAPTSLPAKVQAAAPAPVQRPSARRVNRR